ncbi:site-specific integrase [Janthinobacterium sp. BJB401]|uniref:site-specific integrase n=1 Tax=Janthinobacterium sp. BJB401 TaxID=2745934 RepID=UPI0015962AB9|nr:site-specific integrase [Janthinobacterium sp. BJB401]NVI82709.1 site-specific integrase [Janthinobacterium sp. BJB401]
MGFKQFSGSVALHQALRSPVLLDDIGLPRYWAAVSAAVSSRDLALTTETRNLRYIEAFYVFADELHRPGFLDDMLTQCDFAELGSLLEAYFISLRNRPKLTEAAQKQWRTGLSFVRDVVTGLGKNAAAPSGLSQLETKLLQLDTSYGQLRLQKTRRPATLRSLPAEVVEWLYETLDPESPKNPFKRQITRWRVFIAFVVMLHEGLRRGELLLLSVDAVKTRFDKKTQRYRHWINVQNLEVEDDEGGAAVIVDTRYNKPSIKTNDSIRQIPVSDLISNLIQSYVENFRGKCDHPFLLNTQLKTALSHESLTAYFNHLSERMPASVRKLLQDKNKKDSISPHDLRHTCAVVRLNQMLEEKVPMVEALQRLRSFFGWSYKSDMPLRYARAVFEDRNANVWARILDDRIELVRSIPKGI